MLPSTFYHIYNHANDPENLFRSDDNYRFFLQRWSKYMEPIAETYAYCLMPNHIHFLIRTRSEDELVNLTGLEDLSGFVSQQFSNLFNSYAKAFNKMYERRGSLFNRPFKAKEITSDAYLTNVIFYIHHNPVHHGFVTDVSEWPHTSYHAMVSDRLTRLKRTEVLEWFGSKKAFDSFHSLAIKDLNKLEMEFT